VVLLKSAYATPFDEAVRKLGDADRTQVAQGILDVVATGHERGLPVLQALSDKKLKVDEAGDVFLDLPGGIVAASSGAPGKPQGKLTAPLTNNAVRRVLSPALAQLSLGTGDVEVRLAAAQDLARRPNEEAAPAMRMASEKETVPEVKAALLLALAKLDLASGDRERRLAAINAMASTRDISLRGEFESILANDDKGEFVEKDEVVRDAASSALAKIESRLATISTVGNFFYGLSLGSVLLLAALGLAITFGLMRVINMAHGEMLMIGAYATYVVQNLFKAYLPGSLDAYLLAAIPVAFASAAVCGMALERTVIRYLYGRPLETLLATWGLSLGLIQTVRLIFGAQNVTVANPAWLSGGYEVMPTLVVPYARMAIVAFTVVVVLFVWLLLQRTRLGLQLRAVTQNREMAASMGISVARIDMYTFGLGSGVAGLGGVALSQLGNVGPELGQAYIVDSFMVVVLGGVGNLIGTVIGALGLGMLNKFLEPVTGAVLGKILILVLIVLFIQKRPQGIFALKGRAAEA
jgi:urea transport system permease protein